MYKKKLGSARKTRWGRRGIVQSILMDPCRLLQILRVDARKRERPREGPNLACERFHVGIFARDADKVFQELAPRLLLEFERELDCAMEELEKT
jgi:hypothetical protein